MLYLVCENGLKIPVGTCFIDLQGKPVQKSAATLAVVRIASWPEKRNTENKLTERHILILLDIERSFFENGSCFLNRLSARNIDLFCVQ